MLQVKILFIFFVDDKFIFKLKRKKKSSFDQEKNRKTCSFGNQRLLKSLKRPHLSIQILTDKSQILVI